MNKLQQLQSFGQSIWYDNIQRNMLKPDGPLAQMIKTDGLSGVTSNPSIFEKAINGSADYDAQLTELLQKKPDIDSRELFFSLAIQDIQQAADLLQPVYHHTKSRDGYVSLEVSPDLAHDTANTIAEAKRLAARVNRSNLMIKIPSTQAGVAAIEALTAAGININATLLFSVQRYEEVARAYLRGLQQRQQQGLPVNRIASVASFFVSRVDNLVDKLLDNATDKTQAAHYKGQTAILNAKAAYAVFQKLYANEFTELMAQDAQPQRLLWASTGVKNPAYSDVLYLEQLIGPNTVNTVPPATYKAYLDHGNPTATLEQNASTASQQLAALDELGIDLLAITQQLENEGVKAFADAFQTLLAAITTKAQRLAA